jgi:hypothetical protein|tara:strand:- start:359 stop:778 length:420 start_codon:yes stop_codon:yes gene_type:complete
MIVPFESGHLHQLELQSAQAYLSDWVTVEQGDMLAEYPAYTAMKNGSPLAAAGVVPVWAHRSMAWAFISDTGPNDFMMVHRAVKGFLDVCYTNRIEMTVDCDFPQAHRWAKMLGFKMECERMEAYTPDGRDCALYARVL